MKAKCGFSAVALLLLVVPLLTAEVKLPAEVHVKPGRLVKIPADAGDPKVLIHWINTSEDADLIASETGKYAIFSSATPGRYKIAAYAGDTDPAYCVVIVDGTPPPPPPPDGDPLAKAVQAAYTADADPAKAANVAAMASVFRVAPSVLDTRPDVKTTADLFTWLRGGMAAVLPKGAVPKVEAVVVAELTTAFGAPSATKTLDLAATKTELAKVAAALGGVK